MSDAPTCPYCGNAATLSARAGEVVVHLWLCRPCNASVGCCRGSTVPLGTLANANLRAARARARDAFNLIWRLGGKSKKGAYMWLAAKLGIEPKVCHFDLFTDEQCERTAQLSADWMRRHPTRLA